MRFPMLKPPSRLRPATARLIYRSTADAAPDDAQPDATEPPPPEDAPDVTEVTPPADAEVSDEAPVLEPPSEDVAVLVPETAPESQPRDAPRVAPTPVARPEPDVTPVDEVEQQKVEPSDTPDAVVEEDKPETAPEEATTEIVTEAEKAARAAPATSKRPRTRPAAPKPAEKPEEVAEPKPKPDTDTNAVDNALAEALGTGQTNTGQPGGPPLTRGEKDALRVGVQQCWNVGSLSSEALNTTVVVSVSMTENAKPKSETIRMLSSSGGSNAAAQQAFEAARRAIIRCAKSGYDLPKDKYDHWRDIEMTFNPENMRIK